MLGELAVTTQTIHPGQSVCMAGANPDGMRLLMAGMMSAFFRGTSQDDTAALDWLSDMPTAPLPIWTDRKQ